ncbi:uncharacterized protein LOC117290462 [Asterias rubens]|uniref:uncharacterized protein LOC117290462 n=1 Tax=Asterias rubens TaxID=7604 RepID=UPI001455A034|nr:uncharacterized protein LOC117290462 [Asterias rubens]
MTTAALQISKKGGLVYDSCWFKDGRLHKIINQCNSPPKLSAGVSNSGYQQIEGCSLRPQESNPSDSCQHSTTSLYKNTRHDVPEEKATNDVMTVKREQQMLRTSVINSFQSSGTPDPSALVEVSILECQQHWKTELKVNLYI